MDDLRSQRKVVEDRLAARTESHDQVSHELDRCVAAREGLTGDCRDWRNSSVRNQKKSFERYVERAPLLLLLVLVLLLLLGCTTAAPATTALLPTCYSYSYTLLRYYLLTNN